VNVFLSWSGATSREVARALREWLPLVVQAIKPFMSEEDIGKGERWQACLDGNLSAAPFGIVCVTAQNLEAPAIHFEAGALSNAFTESHVCPFLVGVRPSDLPWTLAQFQITEAQPEDLLRLLRAINKAMPFPLDDAVLKDTFELRWPALRERLDALPAPEKKGLGKATDELVEETLETVRAIARRLDRQDNQPAEIGQSWEARLAPRERRSTNLTMCVKVMSMDVMPTRQGREMARMTVFHEADGAVFNVIVLPATWDRSPALAVGDTVTVRGFLEEKDGDLVLLAASLTRHPDEAEASSLRPGQLFPESTRADDQPEAAVRQAWEDR